MKKVREIKRYTCLHLLFLGYSVGGIFSKKAGMSEFLSREYLFYYMLYFVVLVVYAFFWQQILKKMPLTVAMANKSATVIWGIVCGWLFFQETISTANVVGAIVIMIGIYLVVGADKEEPCT